MGLIIPKGRKMEKEGNTMKILTIMLLVMTGISLVMGIGMVYAAEDARTQSSLVTLGVPANCKLDIDALTANPSKTLTADDAVAAFDAQYIELDANKPTLTVSANKKWVLSAHSSGFGAVTDAGVTYTKDTADLQLKDTGTHKVMAAYTGLSTTDQTVASYAQGVRAESHPCQYKILLDYTKDIPGTYQATVTYTLATQAS